MWAKINHLVRNTPKLRLSIVALLLVSLLSSFAQPAFAADITGTWVKTDQGLTALRVGTSLYFNPGKDGTHWYMTENAAGVKCQSKVEFSDNPFTNATAAKSGVQRFYKEVAEGAGTTGCLEKTGDANNVTISGTPGGATTDPGSTGGTGAGAKATPRCDVGGLSFAICPLINFMADATEWTAHTLQSILYLQPLPLTGNNDLHTAWASILTLANIVLAIAFIFVIFAQATSTALSSYGIKKMLPRIIAAAILMNLSYYICAFAVDLSNLAGVGISGFFSAILTGDTSVGSIFTNPGKTFSNTFGNQGITEFVAGAGVGAIIIFFFLVPVLLAALAVLFTLAARIAIVVLLVMIAPLAFAAWILPNTEKYFRKWYELFFNMLMLFPLVMGTFAASAVASQLIQSSAIQDVSISPEGATGNFAKTVLLPLIALLVQALPLFALPFLFKVAGGTLGRVHAMTQSRLSNGYNNTKKAYQDSSFGKYRTGRKAELRNQEQMGVYKGKNPGRHLRQRVTRGVYGNTAFNKVTGGYGAEALFSASSGAQERIDGLQKQLDRVSPTAVQAIMNNWGNEGRLKEALSHEDVDSRNVVERLMRQGYHKNAIGARAAATSLATTGFLQAEQVKEGAKAFNGNEEELQRYLNDINSTARKSGSVNHTQWNIAHADGSVQQYKRPEMSAEDAGRFDVKTAVEALGGVKSIAEMNKRAIKDGLQSDGSVVRGSMAEAIRTKWEKSPADRDAVLRDAAGLNGQITADQVNNLAAVVGYRGPSASQPGQSGQADAASNSEFIAELQRVRDEHARGSSGGGKAAPATITIPSGPTNQSSFPEGEVRIFRNSEGGTTTPGGIVIPPPSGGGPQNYTPPPNPGAAAQQATNPRPPQGPNTPGNNPS